MKNSIKYLITLGAVFTTGTLLAQYTPNTERTPATGTTPSKEATTEHPGMSDKHFIKEAAAGNYDEISLGRLALQKSQNEQVKKFAQQLIDDHTKANDQLKTLAQNQGVKFPTEADHKGHREMAKLEKLSGSQFDQEFAKDAIRDHAKDINYYNKVSQKTKDQALKQYASSTLPTLEKHLESARSVGTAVGLTPETISSLEKKYTHGMGAPGSTFGREKGGYMDGTNHMEHLNK